jgi:hypothetical protein
MLPRVSQGMHEMDKYYALQNPSAVCSNDFFNSAEELNAKSEVQKEAHHEEGFETIQVENPATMVLIRPERVGSLILR